MQKTVLNNGIRVLSEEIPSAHSVSIGIWVENGSRHEREPLNGISHFVEHMLFKGTSRRNSLDIAKEIDSVGGVLNGFTSREFSCYYAKVLADKLPLAIDLLSDIVLNSTFDPEEIEKERRVILQEILMVEDTPDDFIHDLFSQNFWHQNPLGYPVLGSRDTVGAISRDNLLSLLSERYCGRNILICAAGALTHSEIVDLVGCTFQKVSKGDSTHLHRRVQSRPGIHVDEKDLEQLHICLGTKALPQDDPQRFTSYLLNSILGGSMSSRLFQQIREEKGLAYSVYSYLNCHSDAGALVVYAGTSPEDAPQVIDLMLEEMGKFRRELVSEEELQSAKEQLKGNLLMSLESSDNHMTRLAKNEIYLRRHVPLQEVMEGINRVTPQDICQLAESIFKEHLLNLQVMGRWSDADLSNLQLNL